MTTTEDTQRTVTRTTTRSAPKVIRTPDDIKALYRATQPDGHWFDSATMKWWGTRLLSAVFDNRYGGAYFVTSERTPNPWTNERAYTVRHIDSDGNMDTIGEMGQYATRSQAVSAAKARRALVSE